jgi:anti-sigma factor RsiW
MDHQQASNAFSDYVDGTLPASEKAELEKHLGACIQCRTELAGYRRTVGSLKRLKQTASAPESFLPDVQQQIFRRSRGRFFKQRWKLFGRIPFEWVSLAMIVAMLIYYIMLQYGAPTSVRPG